jgi:hypothetical protein
LLSQHRRGVIRAVALATDETEKKAAGKSSLDFSEKELADYLGARFLSEHLAKPVQESIERLSSGSERLAKPFLESIERLSSADTKNVQQIAVSQLELLAAYHQVALAQSRRSFFWALSSARASVSGGEKPRINGASSFHL